MRGHAEARRRAAGSRSAARICHRRGECRIV
jgi:hypothetical protein